MAEWLAEVLRASPSLQEQQQFLQAWKQYRSPRRHHIPHVVKISSTGSGKSYSTIYDIGSLIGQTAVAVFDPHGSLATDVLDRCVMADFQNVIYSRISDTDKTLGFQFLKRSEAPDPNQRRLENEETARQVVDILLRRQKTELGPLKEEWAMAGIMAFLAQKVDLPEFLLKYMYMPKSPQYQKFLDHCLDRQAAQKIALLQTFSPTQLRNEVAPAARLIEGVFNSAVMMNHMGGPYFPWGSLIDHRGVLVMSGERVISPEIITMMFGTCIMQLVQEAKRRFYAGRPTRLLIVIEECAAFDLIGKYEANALAEMRKFGVSFMLISQTPDFGDYTDQVFQNCDAHFFRCNSPDAAEFGARIFGVPTVDRMKVHHTEERHRQVHDGYEEVERESTTTHYNSEFRSNRSSVSTSAQSRARYRDDMDVIRHYESLSDQILLWQQKLRSLPIGMRAVSSQGRVYLEQVPLLQPLDPSVQYLRHQYLEAMKCRPCFRRPQVFLPGEKETTNSSGSSKSTRQRHGNGSKRGSSPIKRLREGGRRSSKNGNGES